MPWSRYYKNEQRVEKQPQPEIVKPKPISVPNVKPKSESLFENSTFEKGESSKSKSNDDSKFYIKKARNVSQSWAAKKKQNEKENSVNTASTNTVKSKEAVVKNEGLKSNQNAQKLKDLIETDRDSGFESDFEDGYEINEYSFRPKTKKAWVSLFT